MGHEHETTLTITFPNTANGRLLHDAVTAAVEDEEFMEDTKQVSKTAEVIPPKGTVSATFKRLHNNARKDYLDKLDSRAPGYTSENRETKIKSYVTERFQSYMDDEKTWTRATRLFNKAFPEK